LLKSFLRYQFKKEELTHFDTLDVPAVIAVAVDGAVGMDIDVGVNVRTVDNIAFEDTRLAVVVVGHGTVITVEIGTVIDGLVGLREETVTGKTLIGEVCGTASLGEEVA
jgi:hypothetical protein